jgi:hypothetical protein
MRQRHNQVLVARHNEGYSIGVRHRLENWLLTFGFTENLQDVNNTPDVGFQLGVAWIPRRESR